MTRALFQMACLQFLNKPYIWGGEHPSLGYDCSGLAQDILAMVDLDPIGDQTAQALYDVLKANTKEGPRDTGDLIFYGRSITQITHVAIMLDSETCIEAGGGGSKTRSVNDAILSKAFVRLRPFNKRKDIVAVIKPRGLPW